MTLSLRLLGGLEQGCCRKDAVGLGGLARIPNKRLHKGSPPPGLFVWFLQPPTVLICSQQMFGLWLQVGQRGLQKRGSIVWFFGGGASDTGGAPRHTEIPPSQDAGRE